MRYKIPYPPSHNAIYRVSHGGRMYLTKEGREYHEQMAFAMAGLTPGVEPCRVLVEAHRPDRRRRDVMNLLKILLDACQGRLYIDDVQVVDVRARWTAEGDPGDCWITCEEVGR